MEYVSQVLLEVNGQDIDDFKSVTPKEYELRKQVELMNKTGHIAVAARHQVEVDYVVPKDGSEVDWDAVSDGRLTIDYGNGKRVTYTGVYALKVGDEKIDGENETVKTITLGAEGKVDE